VESISQKEHAVITFLVLNEGPLKDLIRPEVELWKKDEPLYKGLEDAFQAGYRNWLLNQVYGYITPVFQLTYEDVSIILDWNRLKQIWKLDEKGMNI
jgi:hypothetical protein